MAALPTLRLGGDVTDVDHTPPEPHDYVPSGVVQYSLFEGGEFEACLTCCLPERDIVHQGEK